jgi:hypothetical protein
MSPPACPACGSEVLQFLGNERETGKSWFACRSCPLTQQVFSLILSEKPRFEFQGRD